MMPKEIPNLKISLILGCLIYKKIFEKEVNSATEKKYKNYTFTSYEYYVSVASAISCILRKPHQEIMDIVYTNILKHHHT